MVTHVDFPKSTIVIVFLALQGTVYLLTTGGEQFKKVHYFAVSSPAPRARITTGDGSDMVGGLVYNFQMYFNLLMVFLICVLVLLFYCLLVFLIISM